MSGSPLARIGSFSLWLAGSSGACLTAFDTEPQIEAVELSAPADSVFARETLQLVGVARNGSGEALPVHLLAWASNAPELATVDRSGLVTGIEPGTATIRASSAGFSDSLRLRILPERPQVARVVIDLISSHIIQGAETEAPRVTVLSESGDTLTDRPVSWSSSGSGIAHVDGTGTIVAGAAGSAKLTASAGGNEASVEVTIESRERFEGDCVFCRIYGASPTAPVLNAARQGVVPRPGDPRDQMVVDETFAVPAGQEVVWDDKVVWIRPQARHDITIRGTLTIRNSLLLWDQTQHDQTRFDVRNGGRLYAADSFAFSTNQFWVHWDFRGGAAVYLNHFQGDPWTVAHGAVEYTAVNGSTAKMTLLEANDATVRVSDAHHVWLELFPVAGTYDLTFPPKREWSDWRLPELWHRASVTMTRSYLYQRDLSLAPDVRVTVADTPDGFGLGWSVHKDSPGTVDCELRGLGNPDRDAGTFYTEETWSLPCINSSLTVRNSVLQRAWPVTFGNVRLRLIDSNLVDPRNLGSPARLEVYGSTVDHVSARAQGIVYLEDTRVRYDVQSVGVGTVVYGFGLTPRDRGAFQVYEEDGGRYVELTRRGPP